MNLTFANKLPRIHYNQAAGAVSLALLLALGGSPAYGDDSNNGKIRRVLLISLDGMHSLDMANYIKGHPQSTLAQLAASGVNYTAASTTKPSDSFPSMVGIVTGGTPAVTGIYYDDAYNRALSPPGSNCSYGRNCDRPEGRNRHQSGGRGRRWRYRSEQASQESRKGCSPVYPHDLLRVNTIFEVIRGSKGGYTAYSEKRPSYDILNGPSGRESSTSIHRRSRLTLPFPISRRRRPSTNCAWSRFSTRLAARITAVRRRRRCRRYSE